MSYHFNGIVSIDTFSSLSPQGAIVSVSVDTASDLPTVATIQTDWNVTPIINSTAKVVDDGSTYVLNSQGTWVQQPGQVFQNTYTKSEVDTLLSAKQDTLTFDTIPTENSTNPVESGGVWSPLSELIDNGAKNILENNLVSKTTNGITATTNADGSVTLTGSFTGSAFILVWDFKNPSASTSYTSLFPAVQGVTYVCKGTGDSRCRVQVYQYNSSSDTETVSNSYVDHEFTLTKSYVTYRLYIAANADFTNPLTIYPMVCTKAQWDISQTFKPYAMTNSEITQELSTVYGSSGYKMVPCSAANTLEYTGISFTVPADSITLIGAFDIYNGCAPQRLVISNNADPEATGFHFVYDTGTVANTFLQLNLCTVYYNIAAAERTLYIHAARYAAHATGNRCGYWTKNLVTPVLLT